MLIEHQFAENDLLAMLDSCQLWLVQGYPKGGIKSSLREALLLAHKFSMDGGSPTRIIRPGPDEVVIEPEQIYWLWKRLGLVVSE